MIYKVISCIFLLSGFIFAAQNTENITEKQLQKLDPRFKAALRTHIPAYSHLKTISTLPVAQTDAEGTRFYHAIVTVSDPQAVRGEGVYITTEVENRVAVRLTLDEIITLAGRDDVRYIDAGYVSYPLNDVACGLTGSDLLYSGYVNNTPYTGSGVLVCIIDTGIDWRHRDFRDPADTTESRILYLWDQTLTPDSDEDSPSETGCGFGVEYTQGQIEAELSSSPVVEVREQDTNGHGTHVAGTAAGNGAALSTRKFRGMAPEADLIIVKSGNGSFPDAWVAAGISYARQKADALGLPLVINMSLGKDASAHDGTDYLSAYMDGFTESGSGRVLVCSAGNSGNDNIHIQGTLSGGSSVDFTVTVPVYSPESGADNDDFEFELWFNGSTNVTARVFTPTGYSATQAAGGSGVTTTADGAIYLENGIDFENGDRYVEYDIYDDDAGVPPAQTGWILRVTNNTGTAVDYHGWLHDRYIGDTDEEAVLSGGDSDYTLGNWADNAVIVGSYVHRWRWQSSSSSTFWYGLPDRSDNISDFSSTGPTRDSRQKPDIAGPGQGMISSMSRDCTKSASSIIGSQHYLSQGTSMSSPAAAGVAALLLQANPDLSFEEVKSLITENADTDTYTGGVPNSTWGYGKINVYKAMRKLFDSGASVSQMQYIADEWGDSSYSIDIGSGSNQIIGVLFTPVFSGKMTGLFFHTYTTNTLTDSLAFELWTDSGGYPGSKVSGSGTAKLDQNSINGYSWNYVDLSDAGMSVNALTSYHIVLFPENTGESLGLLLDKSGSDNSSTFNGSGWSILGVDWRIRPVVSMGQDILARIRIFLEGAYNSGTMSTTLEDNGYIPLTSPYSDDARTVTSVPDNTTDWVLVQLRDAVDGDTLESKSAFLRNDGYIVSDSGILNQIGLYAPSDNYYLAVIHRNHLNVISKTAEPFSPGILTEYDFTTGLAMFFGDEAADLGSGIYGMFKGDPNGTGVVNSADYLVIKQKIGDIGYYAEDCNMTGVVNSADYLVVKSNIGETSHCP